MVIMPFLMAYLHMDYNQDNFMDVVAAYSGTGGSQKVILHDMAITAGAFRLIVIHKGLARYMLLILMNDGDEDILSSGFNDYDIIWYENPGLTPHTIDGNAQGATHVFAGDMDGDGDIDVASTSSYR
jgi:hypothetical protein